MLKGTDNLKVHLENIKKFGLPVVVAINHFASDDKEEVEALTNWCISNGYEVSFVDSFLKGGEGSRDLANKVKTMLDKNDAHYHTLYDAKSPIKDKIETISKEIYRASNIEYSDLALEQIKKYEDMGYAKTPVCMAKTPLSLSDSPKLLNVPENHTIHIKEINLSSGANFLVALTGKVMTMPGLPKVPAAVKMEDE